MRVLVVRARDAADRTAARLQARGHEPIVVPLVEMVPSGEPPPSGSFAALLVTSQNAAAPMGAHRQALGNLPVYAVGARTAAALLDADFTDVRSAGGDAGALARLVAAIVPARASLLHVAGHDRKPEPARTLAALGYRMTVWEAYRARREAALPDAVAAYLRAGRIDAVLHFSRSSAEHLARLAGEARLLAPLAGPIHVCLSEDVAEACSGLAGARVVVAARPTEKALLDALDEAMTRARPGSPLPQSG